MKKIVLFLGIMTLTFTLSQASWWDFGDKNKNKTEIKDKKHPSSEKCGKGKCDDGKCGGDTKKKEETKTPPNKEKCGVGKCG